MSSGSQPPPTPPAKVAPMPLESQAERRRAQLIRIAAALIETEGIDAVTMASVAELAGCTRTQVHRYFAKREDLLAAVVHDFNDRLRATLTGGGKIVSALAESRRRGVDDEWARHLHDAMFDVFEQTGMAGLILLVAPHASGRARDPIDKLRRELFTPWIDYVGTVVGSRTEAEVVVELWMATAYRLAAKWRAGELDRERAVDALTRTQRGILSAFVVRPAAAKRRDGNGGKDGKAGGRT